MKTNRRKQPPHIPASVQLDRLESRCLLSATMVGSTLAITGDIDAANPADAIVIEHDPNDADIVQASINGEVALTTELSSIRRIKIDSGAGDDIIAINLDQTADHIRTFIKAGDGDDIIATSGGADRIFAGDGDDIVDAGDGRNFVRGGAGNDSITTGTDRDRLIGDNGDDELIAGGGNDYLHGGNGADVLQGGEGRDRLFGANDDDQIDGDEGDDIIIGGNGDDLMRGGEGRDRFNGGRGRNLAVGQRGVDRFSRRMEFIDENAAESSENADIQSESQLTQLRSWFDGARPDFGGRNGAIFQRNPFAGGQVMSFADFSAREQATAAREELQAAIQAARDQFNLDNPEFAGLEAEFRAGVEAIHEQFIADNPDLANRFGNRPDPFAAGTNQGGRPGRGFLAFAGSVGVDRSQMFEQLAADNPELADRLAQFAANNPEAAAARDELQAAIEAYRDQFNSDHPEFQALVDSLRATIEALREQFQADHPELEQPQFGPPHFANLASGFDQSQRPGRPFGSADSSPFGQRPAFLEGLDLNAIRQQFGQRPASSQSVDFNALRSQFGGPPMGGDVDILQAAQQFRNRGGGFGRRFG